MSYCYLLKNSGLPPFIYLLPLISLYGRVYYGVHYIGDTIMGAALGLLASYISIHIISKRIGEKYDLHIIIVSITVALVFKLIHNWFVRRKAQRTIVV